MSSLAGGIGVGVGVGVGVEVGDEVSVGRGVREGVTVGGGVVGVEGIQATDNIKSIPHNTGRRLNRRAYLHNIAGMIAQGKQKGNAWYTIAVDAPSGLWYNCQRAYSQERYPQQTRTLVVTFQFGEQSGATHFRPEINNPTEAPQIAQDDAQRFRLSASTLHLRRLN